MSPQPQVLAFGCLEDDVRMLDEAFKRIEPELRVVKDARELAREAVTHRPMAIVLGVGETTLSRLDMISVIHAVRAELPVIVVAENASLDLERKTRQEKIFYYLVHPIDRTEMDVVLQDLLRYAEH